MRVYDDKCAQGIQHLLVCIFRVLTELISVPEGIVVPKGTLLKGAVVAVVTEEELELLEEAISKLNLLSRAQSSFKIASSSESPDSEKKRSPNNGRFNDNPIEEI